VIKNTNLTDRVKLQFRAEFFNVFNNVNFNGPGSTVGTPGFGRQHRYRPQGSRGVLHRVVAAGSK
jgi:hypothetical protein